MPSHFVADYYRRVLDLSCEVLPCPIAIDRSRARSREPRFVTFVDPTYKRGCSPWRIADELGRRRTDIPLLVVEGERDRANSVDCGLDLKRTVTLASWRTLRILAFSGASRESASCPPCVGRANHSSP